MSLRLRSEEFRASILRTLLDAVPAGGSLRNYGLDPDTYQPVEEFEGRPGFPESLGGVQFRFSEQQHKILSIQFSRAATPVSPVELDIFVVSEPHATSENRVTFIAVAHTTNFRNLARDLRDRAKIQSQSR